MVHDMEDITPAVEIRALEPLISTWRTAGRVFDELGAETMRVDGTDAYEWMAGGRWVIHHVDVTMGADRTRALEMIGDPSGDATFVMRAFDASGAFDTMTLRVDGREFHTQGDGVRNTLTVAADGGSMAAVWERRLDDGSWVRWMELDFTRAG
jgi:hypothetical protein